VRPECQDGRVRQAHAAQQGNGADEEGLLGEPPALGSLGGPAEVHAGARRSSEAAGSGSGSRSASSAASGSPSLLVVNGLGQLAAWGSCAGREEAHSSAARCAWVESPLLHRWGRSNGNQIWGQSCHPQPSPPPPLSPPHSCCSRHIVRYVGQCRAVRVWLLSLNVRTHPVRIPIATQKTNISSSLFTM